MKGTTIRARLNELRLALRANRNLQVRRVTDFGDDLGFQVFALPIQVSSDGVSFPLFSVVNREGALVVNNWGTETLTRTVQEALGACSSVVRAACS